MKDLVSQLSFVEVNEFMQLENAAYEFIKAILREYKYCKRIMKKYFNKYLVMSEEEGHLF